MDSSFAPQKTPFKLYQSTTIESYSPKFSIAYGAIILVQTTTLRFQLFGKLLNEKVGILSLSSTTQLKDKGEIGG